MDLQTGKMLNKRDSASGGGRMEYIDALRGFTMLWVIMCHVELVLNYDGYSFNAVLAEFRMPLFFFISGFVLYKANFNWNKRNTWSFIRRKFWPQLFGPTLFLLFICYTKGVDLFSAFISDSRYGYWFTYMLFEFYVFYILIHWLVSVLHLKPVAHELLIVLAGLAITAYSFYINHKLAQSGSADEIIYAIGVQKWCYFIYFIMGSRLRKYYTHYRYYMDKHDALVTICMCLFFVFNLFRDFLVEFSTIVSYLVTGFAGIILCFEFFRKHERTFSSNTVVGGWMQYVGRRTLDVYLIHYCVFYSGFFSPFRNVIKGNNPFGEFLLTFVIAAVCVAICLVISCVLRMSSMVARYVFGARKV